MTRQDVLAGSVPLVAVPTPPSSPSMRKRPFHDLGWFRSRPKPPPGERQATGAPCQVLARNLPELRVPPRQGSTPACALVASGDDQARHARAGGVTEAPRVTQRATSVGRILSSLARTGSKGSQKKQQATAGPRSSHGAGEQLCISAHMTVADMSMRLARPPLSAAEAQRLRRRAYSYDDRHAESISQTLLLASIAYPPAVDCAPSSPPAISKSAARLLQTFPDMADEAPELCSFVCALDHAGLRWYGRIFVARSCLCFAGTGILLGASPSSQQLLAATQWQPSSTTLASYSGSESLGKPATGRPWRKTSFKISYCDITRVSKELTMGMWPNAMTVATTHRHYIFTNFLRRDRAHHCLTSAWNHCLARAKPERPLPLLPEPRKAQAWSQPATPKLSLQRPKPPPVHLDPADGHRARPDASLLLASDSNTCESESTVCDLSPARDLVFPPAQAIQTCRRPNEAQPPSPPAAWHAGGLGIARVASRHPYGYSHHTLFLLAMLAAFGLLLALGAAPAGHGR